ncbi:MAG: hypothetical protein V4479_12335 [Actinomycetota bacterium]
MFATPALAAAPPAPSPLAAIRTASPESLVDVAPVAASLAPVTQNGVTTSLPMDARKGIAITSPNGLTLGISLPFAATAAAGRADANGIISYGNTNGSSTVPILKADGSTQITTVISGPDAPTRYSYALTLPTGVTLSLDETGSVILRSATGIVGIIAVPWAKDAKGVQVPTHFELSGNTVTQVIAIGRSTIAYPVVADPSILWYGWGWAIKYSNAEVRTAYAQGNPLTGINVLCGLLKGIGLTSVCIVLLDKVSSVIWGIVKSAVRDGRCMQVNYPLGVYYEVVC